MLLRTFMVLWRENKISTLAGVLRLIPTLRMTSRDLRLENVSAAMVEIELEVELKI